MRSTEKFVAVTRPLAHPGGGWEVVVFRGDYAAVIATFDMTDDDVWQSPDGGWLPRLHGSQAAWEACALLEC